MRMLVSTGAVLLVAGASLLVLADEKPSSTPGASNRPKTATPTNTQETTPEKHAGDVAEIRKAAETYAQAYGRGNARDVAAHFAADAEYVDGEGRVTQGREAIERALSAHFAESRGEKLRVEIGSIRFVGSGIAIEDGTATVTGTDNRPKEQSGYTALHVKSDGRWLIASVRDQADSHEPSRAERLKQLGWMVGEWISEGEKSLVETTCRTVDDGNFLVREFKVQVAGRPAMNGSQRIAWDATGRHFRVWTFDSRGGFLEGVLYESGNRWVLRSTGQSDDGKWVSATGIFTPVNRHTMTWQNTEYVVDGEAAPAAEPVTIVRQAPRIRTTAK